MKTSPACRPSLSGNTVRVNSIPNSPDARLIKTPTGCRWVTGRRGKSVHYAIPSAAGAIRRARNRTGYTVAARLQ